MAHILVFLSSETLYTFAVATVNDATSGISGKSVQKYCKTQTACKFMFFCCKMSTQNECHIPTIFLWRFFDKEKKGFLLVSVF